MSDLRGYLDSCRTSVEHGKLPEDCESFAEQFPHEYNQALHDYFAPLDYSIQDEFAKAYDSSVNPFSTEQTFTYSDFALAHNRLKVFQERFPEHRVSQSLAHFHALDNFMSFKEWMVTEATPLGTLNFGGDLHLVGTAAVELDGEEITLLQPLLLKNPRNLDEIRLFAQTLPSRLGLRLEAEQQHNATLLLEDEHGNVQFHVLSRPLYVYHIFENEGQIFSQLHLAPGAKFRPIALFTSDGEELEIAMQQVGEAPTFHRKAASLAEVTWEPGNRFVLTETWAKNYAPYIQNLIALAVKNSHAAMRLNPSVYLQATPEQLARMLSELIHSGTDENFPKEAVHAKIFSILEEVLKYDHATFSAMIREVNKLSHWHDLFEQLAGPSTRRLVRLLARSSVKQSSSNEPTTTLDLEVINGLKDETIETFKPLLHPETILPGLGLLANWSYIAAVDGQISVGRRMSMSARQAFGLATENAYEETMYDMVAAEKLDQEPGYWAHRSGQLGLRLLLMAGGFRFLGRAGRWFAGTRPGAAFSRFARNPATIGLLGGYAIGVSSYNSASEHSRNNMKPWERDLAWCIEEGIMERGNFDTRLRRKIAHASGVPIRTMEEYRAAELDVLENMFDAPWPAYYTNLLGDDDQLTFFYEEGVRRFRKEFSGAYAQAVMNDLRQLKANNIDRASFEEAVMQYAEQNDQLLDLLNGKESVIADLGFHHTHSKFVKVDFIKLNAHLDEDLRAFNQEIENLQKAFKSEEKSLPEKAW